MKKNSALTNMYLFLLSLIIITAFIIGCNSGNSQDHDTSEKNIFLTHLKTRWGKDIPENMIHIYPFKSGIFTFRIKGTDGSERKLVMIVDDFGHFESKKSFAGDSQTLLNWTVKRGLDLWHLDPKTNEAILVVLKERTASGIDMENLIVRYGSLEAAENFLIDNRITLLADETLHGHPCQVLQKDFDSYSLIQWVYKGIDLQMGIIQPTDREVILTRELMSANFDEQIPGKPFEIPSEYTVQTTMLFDQE